MKKDGENNGKGKRAYTMSPAAIAQRRAAAVKTGQHAELAGAVAPCKRSACPAEFPCPVKTAADEQGRGLSVCLPAVMSDSELANRFLSAMSGDLEQVRPIAANALALQQRLFEQAGAELLQEGFGIRQRYKNADGVELEKIIPHPAQRTFIALGNNLGHTADSWLTTPAARGDEAAKAGLVDLASFFAERRKKMGGAA